MFEKTGVDGIMIGRASLGNPWIFRDILNKLAGKDEVEVSNEEKLKVILKHIDYEVEEKGEVTAVKEMRKHISWYIKNCKEASKFRDLVNKIETKSELEACITEYFNNL